MKLVEMKNGKIVRAWEAVLYDQDENGNGSEDWNIEIAQAAGKIGNAVILEASDEWGSVERQIDSIKSYLQDEAESTNELWKAQAMDDYDRDYERYLQSKEEYERAEAMGYEISEPTELDPDDYEPTRELKWELYEINPEEIELG